MTVGNFAGGEIEFDVIITHTTHTRLREGINDCSIVVRSTSGSRTLQPAVV